MPAPPIGRPPRPEGSKDSGRSWNAGSIASLPPNIRKAWLAGLTGREIEALNEDWRFWARPAQVPPDGPWRLWLFMGGRGAGKTRAGAEWVAGNVLAATATRVGLVAPSFSEAREVMLSGPSGLLSIGPAELRPRYEPTRRRLEWPNGALGYVYSAEEPEALRGPQFDLAWADEIAAWPLPAGETAFANLELAVRLGNEPRIALTTTPRPNALLRAIIGRKDCVHTRARSAENRANLAPGFLDSMEVAFGGGRLGRQELDGEWVEDHEGAFWKRADIDRVRVPTAPALDRRIVVVDPAVTGKAGSDACGIIGLGASGEGAACIAWVLADATVRGVPPHQWAAQAALLARTIDADYIVAEANHGGELVAEALRRAAPDWPVRLVWARAGKRARAELASGFYVRNRVFHVGSFPALEDEMCRFGATGFTGSPDRLDALVHGLTLLLAEGAEPRIRTL